MTDLQEKKQSTEYILRPIGRISAGDSGSWIWVDPPYREGLNGLRLGADLDILWWLDGCDTPESRGHLITGRKGRDDKPLGVFATHSPHRPNPIALSHATIKAIDVANGLIQVDTIDAQDGSPLLDLKSSPNFGADPNQAAKTE